MNQEAVPAIMTPVSVIHMSEAEAARDFGGLIARVRAGMEVVIDGPSPAVKLSAVGTRAGRLLSESIALAEARAEEAVMDSAYASDMAAIVARRKPRTPAPWD